MRGSLLAAVMLLACTANDGAQRSEFYPTAAPTVTGTGGAPPVGCTTDAQCGAGRRCFVNNCYPIVACTDSRVCYDTAAPLTICNPTRGECVMCNIPSDCVAPATCNANFECVN